MERFEVVGITEEYDRGLELFRRLIRPMRATDVRGGVGRLIQIGNAEFL